MDPLLIKYLTDFDQSLFVKINGEWTNSVLNFILPLLTDLNRNPFVIPIVLAILLFWVFRQRYRAAMWILVLIISVGLSDFVSYRVIKSTAERARPEQAGVPVMLRTNHHSGSSFPSNHAANVFAAASILSAAIPGSGLLVFFLAFMVAYSRVYVGVHFPLDVFAGALLGLLIAFSVRIFLQKYIIRAELSEENRFERAHKRETSQRRKDLLRRK